MRNDSRRRRKFTYSFDGSLLCKGKVTEAEVENDQEFAKKTHTHTVSCSFHVSQEHQDPSKTSLSPPVVAWKLAAPPIDWAGSPSKVERQQAISH